MTSRRLPDLEALALLVTVSETGSLGQAAKAHHISQPSASSRLQTLERHLGVPLLSRSPRGSQLTPEGRVVVDWARNVLDAGAALMASVSALRERRSAALRVAASMTVAEYLLPNWLTALAASQPDVTVGLRVVNSQQVGAMVTSGEVELGFIESPDVPAGLASTVVARDRLVVVVAPSHPWTRRRTRLRPAELAATALVVREAGSGTRETLERALEPFGGLAAPRLELGSTSAVKVALASGGGPAVLSRLAVSAELDEGRLVEVHPHGLALDRELRAVWPEGLKPDGPAAALLRIATSSSDRSWTS
jgi:DNA-binding transcriptional LysR family regulator